MAKRNKPEKAQQCKNCNMLRKRLHNKQDLRQGICAGNEEDLIANRCD